MIFDKIKSVFKKNEDVNVAENAIKENSLKESTVTMPPDGGEDSAENINFKNSEDVINKSENESDIDINEVDSMFQNMGIDKTEEEEKPTGDEQVSENNELSDGIDFDREIEALLQQDASTELKNIDYEYINDISVYDTLRNDKEEILQEISKEIENGEEQGEEKEKQVDKMYLILCGVIGVLLIAIIATVIVVFTTIMENSPKKNTSQKENPVIEQPAYKANDANFIYVSQKAFLDENEFRLSKVLIDSTATLFYFENNIDIQKYDIFLSDDRDSFYGMDLSSFTIDTTNNANESLKGTILSFEPINANARSIKLSVINPSTGEKADFQFKIANGIKSTPVKYVYNKSVTDEKTNVCINIESAVFSSAGSRFEYSIVPPVGNFSIYQGKDAKSTGVSMREGGSDVAVFRKKPLVTDFDDDNIILGRMDFQPVKDLNSKVEVVFNDLYKKYSVNRDIPIEQIGGAEGYTVDFENYRLILEGFAYSSDKAVLVLHTEDKNIAVNEQESENINRIESKIDAELLIASSSGMEVVLKGTSQTAPYGTDMVFYLNDVQKEFISNMQSKNMVLRLNAVLLKTNDLKVDIDLSKIDENKPDIHQDAEESIAKIFEDRLAYKSGEKSIEAIRGFSDELKADSTIFEDYTPKSLEEKANYSAQVISAAIKDDKLYAVVQEVWKGGKTAEHSFRTHKVVAQMGQFTWSIIKDNVIK